MVNNELLKVASEDILSSLGFKMEDDGSSDPRGIDWNIITDKYHLYIDPWCEVFLAKRNPDSDYITLHVPDIKTLERVVSWVTETK